MGQEDQGGRGRDAGIDQADRLPDDQVGVDEPLDVSALSQEQPEGMADGVDRVGDLHGFLRGVMIRLPLCGRGVRKAALYVKEIWRIIRQQDSRKYSARPKAAGLNGAASIALFRRPRESNPHFMRDLFVLI